MSHNATAIRRQDGWSRWYTACPCGWREEARSKEDADLRAFSHNAIAVLTQARRELGGCNCWDATSLEMAPKGECAVCLIDALLEKVAA